MNGCLPDAAQHFSGVPALAKGSGTPCLPGGFCSNSAEVNRLRTPGHFARRSLLCMALLTGLGPKMDLDFQLKTVKTGLGIYGYLRVV